MSVNDHISLVKKCFGIRVDSLKLVGRSSVSRVCATVEKREISTYDSPVLSSLPGFNSGITVSVFRFWELYGWLSTG